MSLLLSKALHFNNLSEGTNQSIVIVLPVTTENKERLEELGDFALYHNGKPYAVMRKPQFYPHRKEERVARQFGTTHANHPHIKVSDIFLHAYLYKELHYIMGQMPRRRKYFFQ